MGITGRMLVLQDFLCQGISPATALSAERSRPHRISTASHRPTPSPPHTERWAREAAPALSDGRGAPECLLPLDREMSAAVHFPGVLVVADHEGALLAVTDRPDPVGRDAGGDQIVS